MPGQLIDIHGHGFYYGPVTDTNYYMTSFGFYERPTQVEVLVGAFPCVVVFVNDTLVQCNVVYGPMLEPMDVVVAAHGRGIARSSATFTYAVDVYGLSVSAGSLAGGTAVEIATSRLLTTANQYNVGSFEAWLIPEGSGIVDDDTVDDLGSPGHYPPGSPMTPEVLSRIAAHLALQQRKENAQRRLGSNLHSGTHSATSSKHGAPHGMLPKSLSHKAQALNDAVVNLLSRSGSGNDPNQALLCGARLSHLRSLVADGDLEEAIDLSLALGHRLGDRSGLSHPDCLADVPHVGEGTVVTTVATPVGLSAQSTPKFSSMVTLHGDEQDVDMPLLLGSGANRKIRRSATRAPVVGFALDGVFVLADSPLRCKLNRASGSGLLCDGGATLQDKPFASVSEALAASSFPRPGRDRRLNEGSKGLDIMGMQGMTAQKDIDGAIHTTGTVTAIAIPVCPSDKTCEETYAYGKIASEHGGSVKSWIQAIMTANEQYFTENSYGQFNLQTTVTDPYNVAFTSTGCNDFAALGQGHDWAYAAAEAAGYTVSDYYYKLVFYPQCDAMPWWGVAYVVGDKSAYQVLGYSTWEAVAHELGHNFGAHHASTMTSGRRGAVAWKDEPDSWQASSLLKVGGALNRFFFS